jgi:hypothetical protein
MTLEDKKAGMLRRKKREKNRKIMLYGMLALLLVGTVAYGINSALTPGELDDFAMCIRDSGAIFYGTTWCPYCNQQKQMFGKSSQYLPYFECSGGRANSISPECAARNVTSVPLWEIDGERYPGMQDLATLSELTGCELE